MKKNKLILILSIMLLSAAPLSAGFQAWLGTGFIGYTDNVTEENTRYYETFRDYYNSNKDSDLPEIDLSDIKKINMVGPALDFSLFPYYEIPIGFKISNQVLFPIGINSKESYRTFSGDLKYRLLIGLDYSQQYTSYFGIFAGFGFDYEYNLIAEKNDWNNKHKPEFQHFSNYGLYGEIGLLTTIDKGYFKYGIDYYHSLNDSGFGYSMIFSGGYRF